MVESRIEKVGFFLRDYLAWWRIWRSRPVVAWLRAAKLFRISNYRTAAELYRRGLDSKPRHPAANCARLDLAYCLVQLGELGEAQKVLEEIFRNPESLPEAGILAARLHMFKDDLASALSVLDQDLINSPSNPRLAAYYGIYAWSAGQGIIRDRRHYERLQRFAENYEWNSRERQLIETAFAAHAFSFVNGETAEQLLCRVLASGYAPDEAYLLRAKIFLGKEQRVLARDHFNRAMRMAPYDPRPLMGIAATYDSMGRRSLSQGLNSLPNGAEEEDPLDLAGWRISLLQRACQLSEFRNPDALLEFQRAQNDLDALNRAIHVRKTRAETLKSSRGAKSARVAGSISFSAPKKRDSERPADIPAEKTIFSWTADNTEELVESSSDSSSPDSVKTPSLILESENNPGQVLEFYAHLLCAERDLLSQKIEEAKVSVQKLKNIRQA